MATKKNDEPQAQEPAATKELGTRTVTARERCFVENRLREPLEVFDYSGPPMPYLAEQGEPVPARHEIIED